MPSLKPDPTFYPSPKMAMESPAEKLAYIALINPQKEGQPDAIGVVDVDPDSKGYGHVIAQTDMPEAGDELHHFGWNACGSWAGSRCTTGMSATAIAWWQDFAGTRKAIAR